MYAKQLYLYFNEIKAAKFNLIQVEFDTLQFKKYYSWTHLLPSLFLDVLFRILEVVFLMVIAAYSEFICVECGAGDLLDQRDILTCQSCGVKYPVVHGVPILFPNVVIQSVVRSVDIKTVAISVSKYEGLPKDKRTLESVKSIFSKNYRFGNLLLDVESKQYLDRIKTTQIQQNTASEKKKNQTYSLWTSLSSQSTRQEVVETYTQINLYNSQ